MASRYFTQFKERKVSASGARPSQPRSGPSGGQGASWTVGGPSAAPTWKPGDLGVGGWPGGFYPGPHPGVENEMHGKGHAKVAKVMHEFKEGTLKSGGSGKTVKNRKQAVAIAMSEAGLSRKRK